MANWLSPNPFEENARPKPGQKIQLRIGWPENGEGKEMWRTCTVDKDSPSRCVSRGTDYSLHGVKKWKKGSKKGRVWRPK